ncbi:MAG: hypothetical protein [Cressdnaviricota sp.]|nr:MAG: hypothetical protein [Cressdnaviricota sp.]
MVDIRRYLYIKPRHRHFLSHLKTLHSSNNVTGDGGDEVISMFVPLCEPDLVEKSKIFPEPASPPLRFGRVNGGRPVLLLR